jgi:hypothetical protein
MTIAESHTRTAAVLVDELNAGQLQGAPNRKVVGAVIDVSLSASCKGNSFRRLGYRHEQQARQIEFTLELLRRRWPLPRRSTFPTLLYANGM